MRARAELAAARHSAAMPRPSPVRCFAPRAAAASALPPKKHAAPPPASPTTRAAARATSSPGLPQPWRYDLAASGGAGRAALE
eukprot:scaffold65618_cov60-Phaeocystis_antarctica.AAC.8